MKRAHLALVLLSLVLALAACDSAESEGGQPGDGSLDCSPGEEAAVASGEGLGGTAEEASRAALQEWHGGDVDVVQAPDGTYFAVVNGRDVAMAPALQAQDGSWFVDEVIACATPQQIEREAIVVDGSLDCLSDAGWGMSGTVGPDSAGAPTPQEELLDFLAEWQDRYGGQIVITNETVGTLVVAGREVVMAIAVAAPAGGWIALTTSGCRGFEL